MYLHLFVFWRFACVIYCRQPGLLLTVMPAPSQICRRKASFQLLMKPWEDNAELRGAWGFVLIPQRYLHLSLLPVSSFTHILNPFLHDWSHILWFVFLQNSQKCCLLLENEVTKPLSSSTSFLVSHRRVRQRLVFLCVTLQHDPSCDSTHHSNDLP